MSKKVVIPVKILGEAENLTKIIQDSQKSFEQLNSAAKINPEVYRTYQSVFSNIQKDLTKLTTKLSSGLSSAGGFTNAEKDINKLYTQYKNNINKIKSLGINIDEIFPKGKEIDKLITQRDGLQGSLEKIKSMFKTAGEDLGSGLQEGLRKQMEKSVELGDTKTLKSLEQQAKDALAKVNEATITDTGKIAAKYGVSPEKATKTLNEKKLEMQALNARDSKAYIQTYGKGAISNIDKELKITRAYDKYSAQSAKITDYTTQIQNAHKYETELKGVNEQLAKQSAEIRGKTQASLDQLGNSVNKVGKETDKMKNKVNEGAQSFDKMSKKASQLSKLKSYFGYMFSITSVFMRLGQAVRGAINDFKELDKQFNEISIVTGRTMNELWGGFKSLNYIASQYGVVTSDVVKTQKLYYQQGRSAAEVSRLTGQTLTLAKISALEFGEAAEYMTSAINAYKIAAEDASKVTDTYSALSTKAAVDANEVAIAMSKVASLAALSGSEFEDTSGYLAKIIETTREAPETAGTALKTVIARFTAVNKLTEDQKELLGDDYNFNNIEKALRMVGVAVKDEVGQMRGFTDILNDLGPLWDELDSNTKHYIATQAAGARQQSRFIALMDDWSRTQELVNVAQNSAGTGARQLALAMDSIETATNKLKTSWQDFYTNFLNSDMVKDFIGILSRLLEIINQISKTPLIGPELAVGLITVSAILVKQFWEIGKEAGKAFNQAWNQERAKQDAKDTVKSKNKAKKQGTTEGFTKGKTQETIENTIEAKENAEDLAKSPWWGALKGKAEAKAKALAMKVEEKIQQVKSGLKNNKVVQTFMGGAKESWGGIKRTPTNIKDKLLYKNATHDKRGRLLVRGENGKLVSHDQLEYTGFGKTLNKGKDLAKKVGTGIKNSKVGQGFTKIVLPFLKKIGMGLVKALGKIFPYAAIAAILVGGITAAIQKYQANQEKKLLATVANAQSKIDNAIEKISSTSSKYLEALDLQQKGLLRTTEENEKYQQTLESLKQTYPTLVKTLSDGTLELQANAQQNYAELMEKNRELIRKEYANIENRISNTKFAASSGVMFSEAGKAIQEGIKTATANLSEMDKAYLKEIGLGKVKTKELTMLQEGGLNRQSLNAAVNHGWLIGEAKMGAKQYLKMLEQIREGEVLGTGSGRKAEYDLIKYYAEQMGMTVEDMADQLIKEADGTSVNIEKGLDFAQTYASEYGMAVSDNVSEAIKNNFKKTDNAEAIVKEFYSQNSKTNIEAYEKALDKMLTSQKITADVSFNMVGGTLAGYMQDEAEKQRKLILHGDDKEGIVGFRQRYNEAVGAGLGEEDFEKQFENFSVSQLGGLVNNVSKVSRLLGQSAAKSFEEQYIKYTTKTLAGNEYLLGQFANVDLTDTSATAKFAAQLAVNFNETSSEYQGFVDLVNSSSNILDRKFRTTAEIANEMKNSITSIRESLQLLSSAIKGELKPEDFIKVMEEFGQYLDVDQFAVTEAGTIKFVDDAVNGYEEIEKISEKILDQKIIEMEFEQRLNELRLEGLRTKILTANVGINSADLDEYTRLLTKMRGKDGDLTSVEREDFKKLSEQIEEAEVSVDGYIETMLETEKQAEMIEASRLALQGVGEEFDEATTKAGRLIEALKRVVEWLKDISPYDNVDAYIQSLEDDIAHYDFVIEFSTNVDDVAQATIDKMKATDNIISANLAKAEEARANAATHRGHLEKDFSQYVSFDGAGNAIVDNEKLAQWAEKIGSIQDENQRELAMDNYNLFKEKVQNYREEIKLIETSTQAAEKGIKDQKEMVKNMRESIVSMEDKFRELFVKRDEEALEALEERYDAMKEADQDYLDSVREAVEEERRIRDRNKEFEELDKMERQLALLRMSGGSATQIQDLEEQIAEKRIEQADKEIDTILDNIEKENEKRHAEMDDEVTYQKQVLENKKANQIAYNAEIAALMAQDKETIMNTWKALDTEFLTSTSTNKDLLEQEMSQMVISALGAKTALADPGGYIPAVEKAYEEVAKDIGHNKDAMKGYVDYVSQNSGGVVLSINAVKDAYIGVYNEVNAIYEKQMALNKAASEYKAPVIKDTKVKAPETIKSGTVWNHGFDLNGRAIYKIGDKWYSADAIQGGTTGIISQLQAGKTVKVDYDTTAETSYVMPNQFGHHSRSNGKMYGEDKNGRREIENGFYHIIGRTDKTPVEYVIQNTEKPEWKYWVSEDFIKLKLGQNDLTRTMIGNLPIMNRYAKGGMVDYTGPAWVDGTPTKPEAFLSASDTSLIASLRDVLRVNHSFGNLTGTTIQKTGDSHYEIHINVEQLGDGYTVEDLIEEIKAEIVETSGKNAVITIK